MKRFKKLYRYAKSIQAKKPFKLALFWWWRGDDFVAQPQERTNRRFF